MWYHVKYLIINLHHKMEKVLKSTVLPGCSETKRAAKNFLRGDSIWEWKHLSIGRRLVTTR